MTPILTAENISFKVKGRNLIDHLNINIIQGSFNAIIGPNGAGKTTCLNLINGDLNPHTGVILLNGKNLRTTDRLKLAQKRAVLPQLIHIPFTIKAKDIVDLGREPYRYQYSKKQHQRVILDCLEKMDIMDLSEHDYATLSGGEQHRVQIARTLAQIYAYPDEDLTGKILFLDEPTNHLDIHHQYNLMYLLKGLQQKGLTIIAVMHDLSLTLQFSDYIVLLDRGKKVGAFTPDELVSSNALSEVYKMKVNILWNEQFQRYLFLPSL
ncbi:ATP-binding cassette domain-containing protein [Pasteurella skyensis]|uniref:ATP-binding cassette domain-containing protein n=1 Tax=Phocoenobacter skyensis TaxID=97481 RepID=A0AAJ6N834_9PAST|nr:ATP-binding cassette domain-containing protein [Pasteurella skyensis]MDP8161786.1 ATP-binding cassette domain-containing protein [Pasteurella skyensis]MDP8171942.1 ATP-binding cassette domain-containing protein [Pasteurella skyensis]MDP8176177.1 ATP-binding cassette domain-containing protein [Pasteurella skyensis]MDP8178197.1 ATP-binding cassette domain-containing protein [Pasteurella skyensis]MDP8182195.1 ATP-binding cassette domain-containing protein [Pasteurella skyensis]